MTVVIELESNDDLMEDILTLCTKYDVEVEVTHE